MQMQVCRSRIGELAALNIPSLLAPFVCVSSFSHTQTNSLLKLEKINILAEPGRMPKVLMGLSVQASPPFLNVCPRLR